MQVNYMNIYEPPRRLQRVPFGEFAATPIELWSGFVMPSSQTLDVLKFRGKLNVDLAYCQSEEMHNT